MFRWLWNQLEWLRSSYWFLPTVMVVAAALLGVAMLTIDHLVGLDAGGIGWFYGGGSDGAREVLSTVATAMLSIAGVTFSITIVVLTLAANQFGPRLLRTFMRDRGTQIALGALIATAFYCLLVLRAVYGEGDEREAFVPALSVTVAMLLATASLGVLIYFIHHIATAIQAPNVVAAVAEELDEAINLQFPPESEHQSKEDADAALRRQVPDRDAAWALVPAGVSGYVQHVDEQRLMAVAERDDLLLRVLALPGDFVAASDPVLGLRPAEQIDESRCAELSGLVAIGPERSLVQDLLFPLDQLAEMAVRALSPSLNDPFTAAQCLDRLGVALATLVSRPVPSAMRADDDGRLRLMLAPTPVAVALACAFDPIRDYADGSVLVLRRLTTALERIAGAARRPADRAALADQVRATLARLRGLPDEGTRGQYGACAHRLEALLRTLETPVVPPLSAGGRSGR